MNLLSRELVYAAPAPGTVAYENSYYTQRTGHAKMRMRMVEVANDIFDHGLRSFSPDNGAVWPRSVPYQMAEQKAEGTLRRYESTGFVDPVNGYLLNIVTEGVLPNDDSLDGMTAYYLKYRVSADGGHGTLAQGYVMQDGYTPEHPVEPVWVGKNCMFAGPESSILRAPGGHLVVSTTFTPLGPDGTYYNPTGGYTWTEGLVLLAHWRDDGSLQWELGERIALPPEKSTRGAIEPTMASLPDGRILMVLRGSNDMDHALPGYKWYCVSGDEGRTWSTPQPWRYTDGIAFHSPSSIAQLFNHSNGRIYWFGNICNANPAGNSPRYPLYVGEVDPASLMLIRASLTLIDDLEPGDHPSLMLSNFCAHEDRADGGIILHMTRMFAPDGQPPSGDAYQYRIAV